MADTVNVTKTIPSKIEGDLDRIVRSLAGSGKRKAELIVRDATVNLFGAIIVGTPIWFKGENEGTAIGSWMIQEASPAPDVIRRKATKGRGYAKKSLSKLKLGQTWYLSNAVPYINILEFGGYPLDVKKGSWSKSGKYFEIRSENGFSKQAPKGMVRINLKRWPQMIASAIKNRQRTKEET